MLVSKLVIFRTCRCFPLVVVGKTVAERKGLKKREKRPRDYNWDPSSEDYTGPWAKYKDEVTISVPSDEDRAYLEAYLAKKAVKKKRVEEAPMSEEKSTLHISTPLDYQVSLGDFCPI